MTQLLIDRSTLEQIVRMLEQCLDDAIQVQCDLEQGYSKSLALAQMVQVELSKEALTAGRAALANAEPTGWQSIDTAPKDGTLVVVYSPNGPDDWPDSLKVAFDYVCPDYEDWFYHCESYEHYMAVGGSNACGPDAVCTGPSQKAPYTHWMPLPAAPKEQP